MQKTALCIGINAYPTPDEELYGCVNDAHDWATTLQQYGFTPQLLLDRAATKRAILSHFKTMIRQAKSGDSLVITFSGHGSWVVDENGDESDGRDEVLCPYDIARNRPIVDDEIAEIFQKLKPDVRLVMLVDACHSGSVSRGKNKLHPNKPKLRTRYLPPQEFVPPDQLSVLAKKVEKHGQGLLRSFTGLLMAGCQDFEVSFDDEFDGRSNGAFTYYALNALKSLNPDSTYQDWYDAIRSDLPTPFFSQTPSIQGENSQKDWTIFQ